MEAVKEFLAPFLPILKWVGIGLLAYLGVFWLGLTAWTYQDVRARSESMLWRLLAPLVVLFSGPLGAPIYLLLRPKDKLAETYARTLERAYIMQDIEERPVCPACQRGVEPAFLLCPYCHTSLKKRCQACGRLMDLTWQICPYCGQ